jgi:hypothetical protein
MREELDKALCEKYPKIFEQRHWDMSKTGMGWGFPGDGWYDILDTLCGAIQNYCDNVKRYDGETKQLVPVCKQVVATQVKQKFGELRFYFEGGDDAVHGMIMMAEYMSVRTCEDCGKPGKIVNTGGYIHAACPKHAKKRNWL